MTFFLYQGDALCAESSTLESIAEQYGTPCFVYSRAAFEERWKAFDSALAGTDHLVCYAVKANSNLAVIDVLARLGSGFDIVSEGELKRVLAAGGRADRTVFAGVGKRAQELEVALGEGVACFNVESAQELRRLSEVAATTGKTAHVSLRVNPDVDAQTHPYISTGLRDNKFGVPIEEAVELYRLGRTLPGLEMAGVDCHIGSQLTSLEPVSAALGRVLALVDALAGQGIALQHLNIGGGIGIQYKDEQAPTAGEFAAAIGTSVSERGMKLLCEPGRAIAGNAGVLLTRIEYIKSNGEKNFAVVDAAMNDLIRPALYQAWHAIEPVSRRVRPGVAPQVYDVVGPVCESSDFLGKEREMAVSAGDLLAVHSAGAYAFGMSSNYNSRPRAAEVMVDGANHHLVRRRESVESLWALESVLPA